MTELALVVCLAAIALLERRRSLQVVAAPLLRPYTATDLTCLALTVFALGLAIRGLTLFFVAGLGVAIPRLPKLPAPWVLAGSFLTFDLGAYACHRLLHTSERTWRFHRAHHSSPLLDWLAAYRAHGVEHALRHLASPAFCLLLGFPTWAVAVASTIEAAWAAFNHANLDLDLGPLEKLFMTPSLHRIHHVPASSDRNFGAVLQVWDRLFGTFSDGRVAATAVLGLGDQQDDYPQTWGAQLIEPWRSPSRAAREVRSAAA